jgi:hypothetical protein
MTPKAHSIEIEIPAEVAMLCDLFDITPKILLEAFMADLASIQGNQGSDERNMAKAWFLRGGIGIIPWLESEDWYACLNQLEDIYAQVPHTLDTGNVPALRKEKLDTWYRHWKQRDQVGRDAASKNTRTKTK